MPNPVRVGVVGTGVFGSHHARHYAQRAEAKLVAVVDSDTDRGRRAADAHGIEALVDHRALIGKVDAVSVTVPATLHHAVAGDLIDAGIHVFVEKPLAATAVAASDLVRRAARSGVVMQVGHIERFSPAFRALKDRVSSPRSMTFVRHALWNGRSTDVDVVLDLMIHDIDLALTLAASPVVKVSATGRSSRSASNDEAEAELHFANGVTASLSASRLASSGRRIVTVTEAKRQLIADLGGLSLRISEAGRDDTLAVPPADSLGAEIGAFLASVSGGPPPEVDGVAGLKAVEIAEMILGAIGTKRDAERKAS